MSPAGYMAEPVDEWTKVDPRFTTPDEWLAYVRAVLDKGRMMCGFRSTCRMQK